MIFQGSSIGLVQNSHTDTQGSAETDDVFLPGPEIITPEFPPPNRRTDPTTPCTTNTAVESREHVRSLGDLQAVSIVLPTAGSSSQGAGGTGSLQYPVQNSGRQLVGKRAALLSCQRGGTVGYRTCQNISVQRVPDSQKTSHRNSSTI